MIRIYIMVMLVMHKYAGLAFGLLLGIIGISGSLLVFDRELDEVIAPETANFSPSNERASLDLVLENARVAVDNGSLPSRIGLARKPGVPHIVRFPTQEGARGPIEVSINPATAAVTAVRTWGEYPVTWVYLFHFTFLAGEAGEYLVGVMGLCLLFFCFSGVVIWWPKGSGSNAVKWRRAFTIKRGARAFRFFYDLHKTAGIYLLPVLVVVAFSGVELIFHEPVEKLTGALLPVREQPSPESNPGINAISVDEAAEIAQSVFPGSRIVRVYLPSSPVDVYRLTFIQPDELWREHGATSVWIDQFSGQVLDIWDSKNLPAGSVFLEWLFPLHNGDALGLFGRLLVFISGFLPALFFATGVYMWWCKRRPARVTVPKQRSLSGSQPHK